MLGRGGGDMQLYLKWTHSAKWGMLHPFLQSEYARNEPQNSFPLNPHSGSQSQTIFREFLTT